MSYIFNLVLFQPLYNALVLLSNIVPGHSIALAIVVLTVIIKTILLPFYHQSLKTQRKLKDIEPELSKIKELYSEDKQKQAQEVLNLYRVHGINPFTGFALLLIQLPVILALFYVFSKGFDLNLDILYPFIHNPEVVDNTLFGLIHITEKSYIFAFLVGITQYIQIALTLPPLPKPDKAPTTPSFKDDLAKSMNMQMRYVMPVIITVVASQFPVAVSIYWLTGNIFTIAHELVVKTKANKLIR